MHVIVKEKISEEQVQTDLLFFLDVKGNLV